MNTDKGVIAVAIAVIALAGLAWFFSHGNNAMPITMKITSSTFAQ